jgi:hypothetical protein
MNPVHTLGEDRLSEAKARRERLNWREPRPLSVTGCAGATFPPAALRRLHFAGGDLLLSRGVKRSGGGWEGVVSNNGTLSRALVRFEG